MGWSVQDGSKILWGDSSRNTVARSIRITLVMTICCRHRLSVCCVTNMRTRGEYKMSQLNWGKTIHCPPWWITFSCAYIICRNTIHRPSWLITCTYIIWKNTTLKPRIFSDVRRHLKWWQHLSLFLPKPRSITTLWPEMMESVYYNTNFMVYSRDQMNEN